MAGSSGGGGGGEGKNGVRPQQRRRKSTGLDTGRKALQHQGVGYPMTVVAAVLRQLHMRVLSVEEMKMLDQVRMDWLIDAETTSIERVCWFVRFACIFGCFHADQSGLRSWVGQGSIIGEKESR